MVSVFAAFLKVKHDVGCSHVCFFFPTPTPVDYWVVSWIYVCTASNAHQLWLCDKVIFWWAVRGFGPNTTEQYWKLSYLGDIRCDLNTYSSSKAIAVHRYCRCREYPPIGSSAPWQWSGRSVFAWSFWPLTHVWSSRTAYFPAASCKRHPKAFMLDLIFINELPWIFVYDEAVDSTRAFVENQLLKQ